MSFTKKAVVVILLVVMTLGIIYIGNKNNIAEEENKDNAYYQTETVYLWYTDDNFTDYFTNAAVEFHELNPDIRVIPALVDSAEYLEHINSASLSEDVYPDLYVLTNDSLERAYLSGLACNVSDSENVLNYAHFSDGALNAVKYHNDYVGYPLSFDTTVLLYNKTYLQNWVERVNNGGIDADMRENAMEDEGDTVLVPLNPVTLDNYIPSSFDDVQTFANEYEAEEGVESVLKWDVKDVFYSYFFTGNYMNVGGDSGDDSNAIDICNDETVACAKAFQDMTSAYSIDPKTSDYFSVLDDFLAGKTVYTIVTSDAIKIVSDKVAEREETLRINALADALEEGEESGAGFDKILEHKYGYANIPDVSVDLKSRSLSVTKALVVNGYSTKKSAANKFAAFVTTDYSPNLYDRTGELAASVDAGYTEEAFVTFQSEYADSIPLSKLVEASNFWIQLEIAFANMLSGTDSGTALWNLSEQIKSQLITE